MPNSHTMSYKLQNDSEKAKRGMKKRVRRSSFVFEEAFRSAALLDGDGQEVGGHVRHQDLFHVAERRPPRHFVQVDVEPGWGRPVQEVRLFHLWTLATQALAHFGLVLEVCGCQVAGAVLSPVRVHVRSVRMQAAVRVELLVRASTGECPAVRVVRMVVVVVVMVVVLMTVTVVLWMSVGHLDQPHVFTPLELSQFVRDVAHLLLCSPLVGLRDRRAAAAVLEAGLRLRASFFGHMDESVWTGLLEGRLVFTGAQLWRPHTYAFSAVDSAGWEDSGNDGSQALSGPGCDNWLWGWVGDVHPSDSLAPELIGLGFNFSLSLLEGKKRGKLLLEITVKKITLFHSNF